MSIDAALYAELAGDSGIAAIVGTRIYPAGSVPASASRPYLTIQRISGPRERHQTGEGLAHPRYQIDAWADTQKGTADLGDAVRAALERFRGTMGSGANTATVRGAFLDDDRDDFSSPSDASERGAHRRSSDYIIWHVE